MVTTDTKANTGGDETIDAFTARVGAVNSQRELAKMAAAETAAGGRKPFLAAIERRQSARAREVQAAQRSSRAKRPVSQDAATGKRNGKPAPQNGTPIAPGSFGEAGARPLAEAYFDKAGEMELSVAFGGDRAMLRDVEPIEGVTVIPRGGDLVNSSVVDVNTDGLGGRVEITHAYLLADGKPFGRCELAAPLPLDPNQRASFPVGHLMFRS
jgi:hypothetical protein